MNESLISVRYAEDIQPKGRHFHDCCQMLYVTEGTAAVTVDGVEYLATPGTLMLIGRFERHAIRILTPRYRRYTVMISPEIYTHHAILGDRLLSVLTNRPAGFCHSADMSGDHRAESLLAQLASENDGPFADQMRLLLLGQLLILYCRARPESVPEDGGTLALIQQVRQYLEENHSAVCTLEELADRFHLSQSYLSHLFKDTIGSSIIAYLTDYRLARAKHLLVETDLEVGKISALCGFSDHSNFGRTFRAQTGLTPSGFRKTYRNTQE